MSKADPVREEVREAIWGTDTSVEWSVVDATITDLLRVMKGHTEERTKKVAGAIVKGQWKKVVKTQRICDVELTHTFESLPEKK